MHSEKKKSFYQKLRHKYRFVIQREDTLEERLSLRLTRLNVFVLAGIIVIVLVILTTVVIAYTPLKEYIPGYAEIKNKEELIFLKKRADSLENEMLKSERYIINIKNLLEGKTPDNQPQRIEGQENEKRNYDTLTAYPGKDDSLLRQAVESRSKYDLLELDDKSSHSSGISNYFFFTPLEGIVSNSFSIPNKHYGIDIVAQESEIVKSTLDGVIILSEWTIETGYNLVIQHAGNLISVYKHNSSLLQKQGDFVKAGSPIAIVGNSGEITTGKHLHFELWHNNRPVNPKNYINF